MLPEVKTDETAEPAPRTEFARNDISRSLSRSISHVHVNDSQTKHASASSQSALEQTGEYVQGKIEEVEEKLGDRRSREINKAIEHHLETSGDNTLDSDGKSFEETPATALETPNEPKRSTNDTEKTTYVFDAELTVSNVCRGGDEVQKDEDPGVAVSGIFLTTSVRHIPCLLPAYRTGYVAHGRARSGD